MALQGNAEDETAKLVNYLQFYDLEEENKSPYANLLKFKI